MQIDIAAHIEKLLFEHETLIVPAFGGFTATKSPASVDYIGGTVAPPAKTLAFNENLTVDDGILVHEVSHANGIATEEARHLVLEFVEQTKAALAQREIVTFPGIGRLYKNYAQKIQFLPDTTNFNTDSFGLPPLQFSPIARARETADPLPAAAGTPAPPPGPTPAPAQTNSEAPAPAIKETPAAPQPTETAPAPPPPMPNIERSQRSNPARSMAAFGVALLLFAVAVGLYFAKRSRTNDALKSSERVVETPATSPSALPGPGGMISEAQKAAESEKEEARRNAAAANGIEDDSKDDDTADEVREADAKKLEAQKKAAEKAKSKEKSALAEESTEKPNETADGRRCVLVIGTYKEKVNATKLLNKLAAAGYDTYYRMQKGHQVGIEFYYKDLVEVQDKMKALQKLTGEDDIWIKKK